MALSDKLFDLWWSKGLRIVEIIDYPCPSCKLVKGHKLTCRLKEQNDQAKRDLVYGHLPTVQGDARGTSTEEQREVARIGPKFR